MSCTLHLKLPGEILMLPASYSAELGTGPSSPEQERPHFHEAKKKKWIREVAEDLGVRFVLEGSIKRAGDQIRINTQLIDAGTGGQIWAERYDYLYADLFALQDEVIGKIVAALSIKLTDQEATLLARRPTENLEAYDFYLRAEAGRNTWGMRGRAEALVNYQKAIALDPNFAKAYSGDARTAVEYPDRYIIQPSLSFWRDDSHTSNGAKPVAENFHYASDNNSEWLDEEGLKVLLDEAVD